MFDVRTRRRRLLILILICIGGFVCYFEERHAGQLAVTNRLNLETGDLCHCQKKLTRATYEASGTTGLGCSLSASARGHHQKVISFTLYGDASREHVATKYFSQLERNAKQVKNLYPVKVFQYHISTSYLVGWTMRVYHSIDSDDSQRVKYLCDVYCQFDHVDLCNVTQIKDEAVLLNLVHPSHVNRLHPSAWRFLAMADPQVDILLSRDLDSILTNREVNAVQQWLESNYTFHVMRDHPDHGVVMLAGLWGAKLYKDRPRIEEAFSKMIPAGYSRSKQADQDILAMYIWPIARKHVMAHDSFTCRSWFLRFVSSVPIYPFPTRRAFPYEFTGGVFNDERGETDFPALPPCPVACRPPNHKDWQTC